MSDGVSKRGVARRKGLEILMERGKKQGISDVVRAMPLIKRLN